MLLLEMAERVDVIDQSQGTGEGLREGNGNLDEPFQVLGLCAQLQRIYMYSRVLLSGRQRNSNPATSRWLKSGYPCGQLD